MDSFYSLLVHVVTHADIQVALQCEDGREVLARPHFSSYDRLCALLLEHVVSLERGQIEVENDDDGISTAKLPSNQFGGNVPIGVRFAQAFPAGLLSEWRLRSRDYLNDLSQPAMVSGIYFPMLAVLLPLWLHLTADVNERIVGTISEDAIPRRHFLYLLSGSAQPRTEPFDITGNSTVNLGRLIQWYIGRHHSQVSSTTVDSGVGGLFSFDRNVRFVQTVLVPLLAAKRREVARFMGEEWPKRFSLMLSLKGDTVARTSALMASLRQFRPDFLHVAETQSFWYGFPQIDHLWENDVEFLSFENVEHSPATSVSMLEPDLQRLVREMVRHKLAFEQAMRRDHEQRAFWLRKTNKPVLSVLMVQKQSQPPAFFTGINIEVSMPTGSLCAERNAIGTCLSSDPSIHRKDMMAMAVLSMTIPGECSSPTRVRETPLTPLATQEHVAPDSPKLDVWEDKRFSSRKTRSQSMVNENPVPEAERAQNPINPCGACKEWLKKIAICNPDFRVLTFRGMHCDQVYVRPVLR